MQKDINASKAIAKEKLKFVAIFIFVQRVRSFGSTISLIELFWQPLIESVLIAVNCNRKIKKIKNAQYAFFTW